MASVKGQCYRASELLYHTLGGKEAGLTPMHVYHEGMSHWYLRWRVGDFDFFLDPSVTQFKTLPPYEEGRGIGFRTNEMSKGARSLLELSEHSEAGQDDQEGIST